MNETLSVVLITKNEEANIRECLEGVKWADEIIIVDDISIDSTVSICREYTDKIYQKKMEGFGAQKQYAIEQASCDWVLSLDADERLSDELKRDIRSILDAGSRYEGYKIWRKTFYLGVWIRHCGWYSPVVRLFKRGKGKTDMKYVHEEILVLGNVGEIRNPMLHYSYNSIEQHMKKINEYSDYDSRLLLERVSYPMGVNTIWYCAIKPLLAFIRKYIIQFGILEGIRGFFISAFTAAIVFLNYAKARELADSSRKDVAESMDACFKRADEWSSINSRDMMTRGISVTSMTAGYYFFFKPFGIFFIRYILKSDYRLGFTGFTAAFMAAFTFFVSHAKLWDMRRHD